MNLQTLQAILYEHRRSPEMLLEAYKLGCRDERAAAQNPHRKINQQLAAMTAAKNKAVEALKSRRELLADCQFPRSYDQTKDEVLIKLDALIAELEEVK